MLPEPLWPKGQHATYDAFVIEVGVRKNRDGTWLSYHQLQDAQDQKVVENLGPSRGLEEGSFALLKETVRAEAMLHLLIRLSNEPELKSQIASAEKAPEELIERIREVTLKQINLTLEKILPGVAREKVEQVHDGLRRENSG